MTTGDIRKTAQLSTSVSKAFSCNAVFLIVFYFNVLLVLRYMMVRTMFNLFLFIAYMFCLFDILLTILCL